MDQDLFGSVTTSDNALVHLSAFILSDVLDRALVILSEAGAVSEEGTQERETVAGKMIEAITSTMEDTSDKEVSNSVYGLIKKQFVC